MKILAKLLGGQSRVKVMRLFLFNQGRGYDLDDIVARSSIPRQLARREAAFLENIGFLKHTTVEHEHKEKRREKAITVKKKTPGWTFDRAFEHATPLHDLLIDSKFLKPEEILRRFKNGGNVKLLIISGVFLRDQESRIDLFIVGDRLRRPQLERSLRQIEAEIGKELRYAILDTAEFNYRLNMYDKFVRDVLDYPHERLIEKIKVE